MTTEHWLTIAAIIAAFIAAIVGPILAELVKSRISQPRPTPATSQPKNLIHRIGGWLTRVALSPWYAPFFILLNICLLLWEFRRTSPITRGDILIISMSVAAIFYYASSFSIAAISRILDKLIDLNSRQIAIAETLAPAEPAQTEPAIRKLPGD